MPGVPFLIVFLACSGRGLDTSHEGDDSDATTPTDTMGTVTKNGITVWLDPDVKSMLRVSWEQDAKAAAHLEYSFDDGVWVSSPTAVAETGTNTRVLVGIPFDTDVELKLVVDGADTVEGPLAHTGPIPHVGDYVLPQATVLESDAAAWYQPGNYLLTSINDHAGGWRGGTYWTIVVDRKGRMVWAHAAPDSHWTLYVTVDPITRDHFLWDESTKWSVFPGDGGDGSVIHRAYLDEEITTIPTKGLHHEWIELPDGTLVWGSQSASHSKTEALVELAPGASEPTVIWTCDGDWPGSGQCESNGLFYNPPTNSYLYSFYTNNSLVEIDRATGTSLWWAGAVEGGDTFDPKTSQFSWQHGVSYTAAGTLLLSTKGTADGASSITTFVREYDVDRKDATLHDVWHCDSLEYASTNGDAWRLANGNTLHVIGAAGQVKEYLPDCTVAWHIDFGDDFLLGRGELVDDLYSLVSPRGAP